MDVKIMPCTCKHEYQNQVYGKGMRLHTVGGGKNPGSKFTCTVCGKEKRK